MSRSSALVKPGSSPRPPTGEWERLRSLLLGAEQENIDELTRRLGDQDSLATSVAEVLPEAISKRASRDDDVCRVLGPVIEDSIQQSVRENPRPLVDALFPIIGPAIRRSIAQTLAEMMQAFNSAVEKSLSPQALKWRFDAIRTGQSYANVVLMQTLLYQVEQVFLIHRETGLLLSHVQAASAMVKDPAMVSGMLTAIQDFVADSFDADNQEGIDRIRLGDVTVLVKTGPQGVLAAVVRGTAPESLGVVLSETLEKIHRVFGQELQRFAGDMAPFEAAETVLTPCLKDQRRAPVENKPWKGLAVMGLAMGLILWWLFARQMAAAEWRDLVTNLDREPGLTVTAIGTDGPRSLRGLRDPLARDPSVVVGLEKVQRLEIRWEWEPYLSLEPDLVAKRARQILSAPDTVSMLVENRVLRLEGTAPQRWIDTLVHAGGQLPGITGLDTSGLRPQDPTIARQRTDWQGVIEALRNEPGFVVLRTEEHEASFAVAFLRDPLARGVHELGYHPNLDITWHEVPYFSADPAIVIQRAKQMLDPPAQVGLQLEAGVLNASGSASSAWIEEARERAILIPGVVAFTEHGLEADSREILEAARRQLESAVVYFTQGGTDLDAQQLTIIEQLLPPLQNLQASADELGIRWRLKIIGHADPLGAVEYNLRLSQTRAETVRERIAGYGYANDHVVALGMGENASIKAGQVGNNRRVTFQVEIAEP